MKYFIDTEFIEGFHKSLFGKRRHFIDLISIGIICEDGREYYAISNEFSEKDANDWVKENVISKLPERRFNGSNVTEAKLWKSNQQIRREVMHFCGGKMLNGNVDDHNIQFYGYYSDYDWVLFCSLFGTMMDLPKGFPMYCIDLKQTLDEKVAKYKNAQGVGLPPSCVEREVSVSRTTEPTRILNTDVYIDRHPEYPKQSNEHNALDDAKWNKRLYEFLLSI